MLRLPRLISPRLTWPMKSIELMWPTKARTNEANQEATAANNEAEANKADEANVPTNEADEAMRLKTMTPMRLMGQ